jgi:hypothetical protein
LCLSASSYGGGDVLEAVVDAVAAVREPLGRNNPMQGVGCSGKDELGDNTGEECVSIPFSDRNTVNN